MVAKGTYIGGGERWEGVEGSGQLENPQEQHLVKLCLSDLMSRGPLCQGSNPPFS